MQRKWQCLPKRKAIDPKARIVTPSPGGAHSNLTSVADNLATYFRTNVGGADGGAFADILGFPAYVSTSNSGRCPIPEDVNTVVDNLNSTLASFASEQGKPWFNTEGGWSKADDEGFLDPDRQVQFFYRVEELRDSPQTAEKGEKRGWQGDPEIDAFEAALRCAFGDRCHKRLPD